VSGASSHRSRGKAWQSARRTLLSPTFWTAVAALGVLWAALEANEAAKVSRKSVEIEAEPVLLLSCHPDLVTSESSPQSVKILELSPTVLNGLMEASSVDVIGGRSSQVFACSVTNYGRLAAVNLQLEFSISFVEGQKWPGPIHLSHEHRVVIPGLAPSGSYDFLVVNASTFAVKVVPSTSINLETPGRTGAFQAQLHLGGSAVDMFVPYVPDSLPWSSFRRQTGVPVEGHQ
jgi:hypothetical protein